MLESFLSWAEQNQDWALLIVPMLAFMETCFGIGLFVSSLGTVVICSVLYSQGWATLASMSVLGMLGSSAGDHLGYYLGRAFGENLKGTKWAQKHQKALSRTENLVERYGVFAIFIGRFIPAIRSLIPAMLGISEFRRLRYSILDLMACGLWALGLAGIVIAAHEIFAGS